MCAFLPQIDSVLDGIVHVWFVFAAPNMTMALTPSLGVQDLSRDVSRPLFYQLSGVSNSEDGIIDLVEQVNDDPANLQNCGGGAHLAAQILLKFCFFFHVPSLCLTRYVCGRGRWVQNGNVHCWLHCRRGMFFWFHSISAEIYFRQTLEQYAFVMRRISYLVGFLCAFCERVLSCA